MKESSAKSSTEMRCEDLRRLDPMLMAISNKLTDGGILGKIFDPGRSAVDGGSSQDPGTIVDTVLYY